MACMQWITRTISWHRRSLAAVLAALGILALVSHLSGAGEASDHVVVTTGPVIAGVPITASSVMLQLVPRTAIPVDAITELHDVVGRPASVSMSARTVIQRGLLVSGSSVGEGRALVPIMVPDGQLRELLSPGLRIALVSAGDQVAGVLTEDAVVHSMPQMEASSFVGTGQAALVLVEVPSALAPEVSVLGQTGQLTIFLSG